jgi:hypothetical protein
MPVNKGRWDQETGYAYICWRCNGSGSEGNCPDCYDLDYGRIMHQFRAAQGQRYYALLKAALSIRGKEICDHTRKMRSAKGKLSPADMCFLLVHYGFPKNRLKPLMEWLEETRVIPGGSHRRLKERGFKVSQALRTLKVDECSQCQRLYYREESAYNGLCIGCDRRLNKSD